jgi:hypothetical protein
MLSAAVPTGTTDGRWTPKADANNESPIRRTSRRSHAGQARVRSTPDDLIHASARLPGLPRCSGELVVGPTSGARQKAVRSFRVESGEIP